MSAPAKWQENWQVGSSYQVTQPRRLRQSVLENASAEKNTWKMFFTQFFVTLLLVLMGIALLWCFHQGLKDYKTTPQQRFMLLRQQTKNREERKRMGGKLELSVQEQIANIHLKSMKSADDNIWKDHQPRPHFFKKYNIRETDLYNALHSMPKGGLLHVHDAGMFKTDLLIELAHHPDLWGCVSLEGIFEDFRFSRSFPQIKPSGDYECNWQLMNNFWAYQNNTTYLERLRHSLSLNTADSMSSKQLARHLERATRLVHGLITFRPVWPTFLFSMLEDFYGDGVTYVELRTSLPILYDTDGHNYTIIDTAASLLRTVNMFRSTFMDFIGLKVIYAPVRDYNDSRMSEYLDNAQLLKTQYPELFGGLDLFSFEDACQQKSPLENVQLLHINKEIDFYFHAGDPVCPNSTINENSLIDALLLGSKRIANALNLPQHPELLRLAKIMNIAVEVCPLSDHYLQYINDYRTHPAAYLIATGFPIIVGSDYPYLWKAAPLTDDFYIAFVGLASNGNSLKMLKQLAMNSLLYSSLNEDDKEKALSAWRKNWAKWINEFVAAA